MTGRSLQIQRYLLLVIAGMGLGLLAYLLRIGWLQTLITEFDSRNTLGVFREVLERVPDGGGHAYLGWFQYLLAFTLAACFAQVFLSLLRPVRNPVLLTMNWGILLIATGAMLFYWVFGVQPRSAESGSWLVQAAVLCCVLAMHVFGRAFLAFPAPLTKDRLALYRNRYVLRRSAEFARTRRSPLDRWYRSMSAWELRAMRSRKLLRPQTRAKQAIYVSRMLQFMLLYVLPSATFASLAAFWSGISEVGMVGALMCMVWAWLLTMQKILMDYRLGDANVRKQVLWLVLSLSFPLWAFVAFILSVFLAMALAALGADGRAVIGYFALFLVVYVPLLSFLLFVLCLMISIFFYGAIDPERVLRASALYSFLGLMLTVIFAVLEQVLSPLLTGAIGMDGKTGALVSAVCVALTFRPAHRYIEAGVTRAFQKLLRIAPPEANPGANPG